MGETDRQYHRYPNNLPRGEFKPKFYGGKNPRKTGKRKEEKIFTPLLRKEETFHTFRDDY